MLNKLCVLLVALVVALATVNAFNFNDNEIEPKIVQGQNATRGQFPYYVFLKIQLKQGKGACGGSLISNQYVVSAGHCLKGASEIEVHLGSLRAADLKEKGRVIVNVTAENIFVHPKYLQLLALNDIGLIKLPKPVEFSDTIKPVELACTSKSGLDVIAIGNGKMDTNDKTIAPILQYTQLKTISLLQCLPDFPIIGLRKSIICARGVQQRSVCSGDSGGPLISANSQALVGLSSFVNIQGCNLGFPQGFTHVPSYLKWINEVTGISDCKQEI